MIRYGRHSRLAEVAGAPGAGCIQFSSFPTPVLKAISTDGRTQPISRIRSTVAPREHREKGHTGPGIRSMGCNPLHVHRNLVPTFADGICFNYDAEIAAFGHSVLYISPTRSAFAPLCQIMC